MFKHILYIILFGFSGIIYAQTLSVEKIKENQFVIKPSEKGRLYWSASADSWNKAVKLKRTGKTDTFRIQDVQPVIMLKLRGGKSIFAAPRPVELQGGINFRDLGGYITKTGRQVKWGKIYRSADISKLTDQDLVTLIALNLKMDCDLRGEKESEAAPDRLPEGVEYMLLPAGSENIGTATASYDRYMKGIETADSFMRVFYARTDHLAKKYKPMFDALLKLGNDQALLFHCTAGKDRTGIGAALILYVLGVDEETILKDYELTNLYRKEYNHKMIKTLMNKGLSEETANYMMSAQAKFLKNAIEAIKNDFGSLDLFLLNEMELTADKKALLLNKYLY